MCIDRYEMHIAPIVRVIATAVRQRDALIWNRVNGQIREGVRHVVIVISWTWKERYRAHRRGVKVKVVSLVRFVIADHVHEIARVKDQRRFFGRESLRNDSLLWPAPATIAQNDKREGSGTGGAQTRFSGGGN